MVRIILFAALVVMLPACRRESSTLLVQEEQPASGAASMVQVADPKTASQLLKGWHGVEQGSWRWTEKQFSVALKPPAAGKQATLELKFALPEPVIGRLRSISLSATVNGTALPAETYTQAGTHVYSQTVPGAALAGEVARFDFALDKALPPSDADRRELGLVVSSVGLE